VDDSVMEGDYNANSGFIALNDLPRTGQRPFFPRWNSEWVQTVKRCQ